jgi:hypothetical protein
MLQMCAYDRTTGQKSKQVAYVGNDLQIYEIYQLPGQKEPAPAAVLPAPSASVTPHTLMCGFQWVGGKSKHVVYSDGRGHLHELACTNKWSHADLFDGQHIADPDHVVPHYSDIEICGFDWAAQSTKQVMYYGVDGSLQELSMPSNQTLWGHANLTKLTETGGVVSLYSTPLSGYDWTAPGIKQVVGAELVGGGSQQGHLHLLKVAKGQKWSATDISKDANAPSGAQASESVYYAGRTVGLGRGPHGNYIAWLHGTELGLFFLSDVSVGGIYGNWTYTSLDKYYPSVKWPYYGKNLAACDWVSGGFRQIYFFSGDGHIHELYQPYNTKSRDWNHADLMQRLPNAPVMLTEIGVARLVAYEWTEGASKQIVYPSADYNLHELTCTVKDGWSHRQLTGIPNGGPPARP